MQPIARSLQVRASRLAGRVRLAGAKNSVLRLMAACLLTDDEVSLENYPEQLLDVQIHRSMLERLGKRTELSDGTLKVSQAEMPAPWSLDWEGRSIRNTLLICGALLARHGHASVPLPGGCSIGGRGYDLHQLVFEALGARTWVSEGRLNAQAGHGLKGNDIKLPLRSTGATENALIVGSLARGRTRLWNPHVRPEILDLAKFLNAMGAQITFHGTECVEIEGVDALHGTRWRTMSDNLEAMTWAIGATMTRGEVEIGDFPFDDLEVPLIFLKASGAEVERRGSTAIVRGLRPFPVEISTGPYPGINSDMQPLFAALAAAAKGISHIVDLRFPDRFCYLDEFSKMGVASEVSGQGAKILGGNEIRGAEVRAVDLRGGAALALLGLVAKGTTTITEAWQIERGYSCFAEKLAALGVDVMVS